MSWENMLAHEARTYNPGWAFEDYKKAHPRLWNGVTARNGWARAIEWITQAQLDWPNLTVPDAIRELRAGEASIFWPLFWTDPHIIADCPDCHRPVLVAAEGFCPRCTHNFAY